MNRLSTGFLGAAFPDDLTAGDRGNTRTIYQRWKQSVRGLTIQQRFKLAEYFADCSHQVMRSATALAAGRADAELSHPEIAGRIGALNSDERRTLAHIYGWWAICILGDAQEQQRQVGGRMVFLPMQAA